MQVLLALVMMMFAWSGPIPAMAQSIPNLGSVDIAKIKPDLVVPLMVNQVPAPGARVRQTTAGYEKTQVHHALYLPTDWAKGKTYPVIVEYAGNKWKTSSGTVQGSNLGYGMSGGKGYIWICMPYLSGAGTANVETWWGDKPTHDPKPTVDYCIKTVRQVCKIYGGDLDTVILAGFSRGSIACNFIGLHNDEIAKLWRGFVCYSHYDGVDKWSFPGAGRADAISRLKRLKSRPQFICCEAPSRGRDTLKRAKDFIESADIKAPFTYSYTGFIQHDDAWILRPSAARKKLRAWLQGVVGKQQ